MSGTIRLSLAGEDGIPMVARVVGAGSFDEASPQPEEVVVLPREAVEVTVDAGMYAVQLLLPSGGIIQRNCEVADGLSRGIEFDARGRSSTLLGSGERFSLQAAASETPAELIDVVTGMKPSTAGGAARSRRPTRRPRGEGEVATATPPTTRSGYGAPAKARPGRLPGPQSIGRDPPRAVVGRPRALAGTGAAGRVVASLAVGRGVAGHDEWRLLARDPAGWGAARVRRVEIAPATPPGGEVEMWRIPGSAEVVARRWAVVDAPESSEVVSLPFPWSFDGGEAFADLLVDARVRGRAMSRVAVRDSGVGGLLAYLDQGRMSLVEPFLARLERTGCIQDAIHGPRPSPLAACVAAYARLGVMPRERSPKWDGWLRDLMERNPNVPDCAIVYARLVALRPDDLDEAGEVPRALDRAVRAGVPYFSAGVQLLRDMLMARSSDPAAASLLEIVRPVAARCDPGPFVTVLRYPRTA